MRAEEHAATSKVRIELEEASEEVFIFDLAYGNLISQELAGVLQLSVSGSIADADSLELLLAALFVELGGQATIGVDAWARAAELLEARSEPSGLTLRITPSPWSRLEGAATFELPGAERKG